MPTTTITLSPERWERLCAALQQFRDPEEYPDETDVQLARRWFRLVAQDVVWAFERDQQGVSAVPDFDMVVE